MEHEVGKYYSVPHAKMVDHRGRVAYVPVIGPAHSDPQLLVTEKHMHIDGRFVGRGLDWLSRQMGDQDGETSHIIRLEGGSNHWGPVVAVVERRAKCVRERTGLYVPTVPIEWIEARRKPVERYWAWYEGYVGKSCLGKKCPHLGQEMLDIGDGAWRCPLHGLHGDAKTEKIVNAPKNRQI